MNLGKETFYFDPEINNEMTNERDSERRELIKSIGNEYFTIKSLSLSMIEGFFLS